MWRALMICLIVSFGSLGGASAQDADSPARVSLVSLIANPAAFEGKRVQVVGYLTTVHFEDCALYLSKSDFDQAIASNAVRLQWAGCYRKPARTSSTWSTLSGHFAVVEGTFRTDPSSQHDLYAGLIDDVTRIAPSPSRAEFVKSITMPWWLEYRLELAAGVLFVAFVTFAAGWITRAVQSRLEESR